MTNKSEVSTSTAHSSSAFATFCKKIFSSGKPSKEKTKDSLCNGRSPSELEDHSSETSSNSDDMKRVFSYFDEDGDGKVSPAELQRCVRAVGGELSEEEAEMAVRLSDSDGDGMLGLEDFSKLIMPEAGEEGGGEDRRREEELREAFRMYEMKGTDCITPKSLRRMLSRLGESTSIENCRFMIGKFDLNGDGVLSFDEFRNMMT